MRLRTAAMAFVVCVLFVRVDRAVVFSTTRSGGKTILCMHTGLMSELMPCGLMSDWYTYVFVGRIISITPAGGGEKTLQIDPEEIFKGNPQGPLKVVTSQGDCLPPLKVGHQWLFYLEKQKDEPITLDYYGNVSLPVADAQEQIETLRQLRAIGNRGIVRGAVTLGRFPSGKPVANAKVIARGGPGDQRYAASTNRHGRYQFPPLPVGSYSISTEPIEGVRPETESVDLNSGGCWDVTLDREPRGQISGIVHYSDGSPLTGADVMLVSSDGSFLSQEVDKCGHFEFDLQEAGKYSVGLMLHGKPRWADAGSSGPPPPGLLYYPNAPGRSASRVINLRADEKRDNIDFTIPAQ